MPIARRLPGRYATRKSNAGALTLTQQALELRLTKEQKRYKKEHIKNMELSHDPSSCCWRHRTGVSGNVHRDDPDLGGASVRPGGVNIPTSWGAGPRRAG